MAEKNNSKILLEEYLAFQAPHNAELIKKSGSFYPKGQVVTMAQEVMNSLAAKNTAVMGGSFGEVFIKWCAEQGLQKQLIEGNQINKFVDFFMDVQKDFIKTWNDKEKGAAQPQQQIELSPAEFRQFMAIASDDEIAHYLSKILGIDKAAELFKGLTEEEIEAITLKIAMANRLPENGTEALEQKVAAVHSQPQQSQQPFDEKKKRIFAIGDIHGQLDLLQKLEDEIFSQCLEFSDDYEIIITGDLMDRGPQCYELFKYVQTAMNRDRGKISCLLGNHDEFYIQKGGWGIETAMGFNESNKGFDTIDNALRYYEKNDFSFEYLGDTRDDADIQKRVEVAVELFVAQFAKGVSNNANDVRLTNGLAGIRSKIVESMKTDPVLYAEFEKNFVNYITPRADKGAVRGNDFHLAQCFQSIVGKHEMYLEGTEQKSFFNKMRPHMRSAFVDVLALSYPELARRISGSDLYKAAKNPAFCFLYDVMEDMQHTFENLDKISINDGYGVVLTHSGNPPLDKNDNLIRDRSSWTAKQENEIVWGRKTGVEINGYINVHGHNKIYENSDGIVKFDKAGRPIVINLDGHGGWIRVGEAENNTKVIRCWEFGTDKIMTINNAGKITQKSLYDYAPQKTQQAHQGTAAASGPDDLTPPSSPAQPQTGKGPQPKQQTGIDYKLERENIRIAALLDEYVVIKSKWLLLEDKNGNSKAGLTESERTEIEQEADLFEQCGKKKAKLEAKLIEPPKITSQSELEKQKKEIKDFYQQNQTKMKSKDKGLNGIGQYWEDGSVDQNVKSICNIVAKEIKELQAVTQHEAEIPADKYPDSIKDLISRKAKGKALDDDEEARLKKFLAEQGRISCRVFRENRKRSDIMAEENAQNQEQSK